MKLEEPGYMEAPLLGLITIQDLVPMHLMTPEQLEKHVAGLHAMRKNFKKKEKEKE